MHGVASLHQVVGELATNQAGTDNQHTVGMAVRARRQRKQLRVEAAEIVEVVDALHRLRRIALHGDANRVGTRGQHELPIRQNFTFPALLQRQRLRGGVHSRHRGVRTQADAQVLGHGGRRSGHQLVRAALLAECVGQGRLGIKVAVVPRDDVNRNRRVELAQFARRGPGRQTGAHDDDRLRGCSAHTCTTSKSALATPQSGQAQSAGTSAHKVPAAMPSSGRPKASSYTKPHTMHI